VRRKWIKITLAALISIILILSAMLAFTIHSFNQKAIELRWHVIQHMQFADYYIDQYQKTHKQNDLNETSKELAKASEVIFVYAYIYKPELENLSIEQLDVLADAASNPKQAENVKQYLDSIMALLKPHSRGNLERLGHDRHYFEATLLKVSHALPNPLYP
jgi:hypothetical protein